jgi:hypothetical protein
MLFMGNFVTAGYTRDYGRPRFSFVPIPFGWVFELFLNHMLLVGFPACVKSDPSLMRRVV